MAQPLQYQQTYVPTDFGSVSQLANLYTRDTNTRDQMFDQGIAMQNQLLSEFYGQETADPDVLKGEVNKFANKIDELVKRRGGDYGAAAKDIAQLGVKEISNPIYQLNKKKVEQVKMLEQSLANNPSLFVLKDPRQTKLSPGMKQEDLTYELADPANIQKSLMDVFGKLGTQLRESDPTTSKIPGYLEATTIKGLTKQEIEEMRQDPEVYNTIIARNPQLEKYLEDPRVNQWLTSQVSSGLSGLEGGQTKQFLRDYTYSLDTETAGTPPGYVPLARGANLGIKNDRPFNSVQELNNIDNKDPRYLIAQKVKDSAYSSLNKTEQQFINEIGGIDAMAEINEIGPMLPSAGSGLSKTIGDVGKIFKTIGSFAKGVASGTNPAGLVNAGINFQNAKDNWEQVKEIKEPLQEYLDRKEEVYKKYNLDKLDKQERDEFISKVTSINNRFNRVVNDNIKANYGDLLGDFYSHDYLTGDKKTDSDTEALYKRLNDRVATIPFDQFSILSSNSDLDLNKQQKLRKKGNEEYLFASSKGHYRILETHVDPELGPMYLLETDKKGGGVEHHLARLDNTNYNQQLLSAYGSNNIPKYFDEEAQQIVASDLMTEYQKFMYNEGVKTKYRNSLSNLPKYNEFKGGTINQYLEQLKQDRSVSPQEVADAIQFIKLTNAPGGTKLK